MVLFCSFYPCAKELAAAWYRHLIENSISQSGAGQNASLPSRTAGRQLKQGVGGVLSQIVEFFLPFRCFARLASRLVKLHQVSRSLLDARFICRRYPVLTLFHSLITRNQQRPDFFISLLAQQDRTHQPADAECLPVVRRNLLPNAHALTP